MHEQNAGSIIGKAGSNMKRLRHAVSYFLNQSFKLVGISQFLIVSVEYGILFVRTVKSRQVICK